MRLVNHEFENKITPAMYRQVVVPFIAELYAMDEAGAAAQDSKGKGKVSDIAEYHVMEGKRGGLKDGMNIFRSFGSRIQKFGMSVEMDTSELASYLQA